MTQPLPTFDVNAFAEAAQNEVMDDIHNFLVELEKKHDSDDYKAIVTGNVLINDGIGILIGHGINPNDLMRVISMVVQSAVDGEGRTHFAIPANVADYVKVPEGKPQ